MKNTNKVEIAPIKLKFGKGKSWIVLTEKNVLSYCTVFEVMLGSHDSVTSVVRAIPQVNGRWQNYPSYLPHSHTSYRQSPNIAHDTSRTASITDTIFHKKVILLLQRSGQLVSTTYGCGATTVASKLPNFRTLAYFPHTNP